MNSICTIDLSNLVFNYKQIKQMLSPETKVMGVVKADAYGHGAVKVSKKLQDEGIDHFAVALAEEGEELRRNGIIKPILIFGKLPEKDYGMVFENSLEVTVFDRASAEALNEKAKEKGIVQNVHIKIDSGMGRLGIADINEAVNAVKSIVKLSNIRVKGIYSHFSVADSDPGYTNCQFEKFCMVKSKIGWEHLADLHICNSAATLLFPHMHLDIVRPGLSLYGLYPGEYVKNKSNIELRPVMSVKTRIAYIKKITEPSYISYGNTYRAEKGQTICTLPIGYADGIPRTLSGQLEVLINGKRCKSVGTICMDHLMVACEKTPGYEDEVVVMGKQSNDMITADEIAKKAGTINYEIVSGFRQRIRRIYV